MRPLRIVDSRPPEIVGPIDVDWESLENRTDSGYERISVEYGKEVEFDDRSEPLRDFFDAVDITLRRNYGLDDEVVLRHSVAVRQGESLMTNHSILQGIQYAFSFSTSDRPEILRPLPSHLDSVSRRSSNAILDHLFMARFEGTVFNPGRYVAAKSRFRFTSMMLIAAQTRMIRGLEVQIPEGYAGVLDPLTHVHRSPIRRVSVDGQNEISLISNTVVINENL